MREAIEFEVDDISLIKAGLLFEKIHRQYLRQIWRPNFFATVKLDGRSLETHAVLMALCISRSWFFRTVAQRNGRWLHVSRH